MSYSTVVRQTDWSDFDWFVDIYIPKQVVRSLKDFGDIIRDKAGIQIYFRTGELKASHVSKIQNAFKALKANNAFEQYASAREACERLGAPQFRTGYQSVPTFGGVPGGGTSYGTSAAGPSRSPYAPSPSRSGWQSSSTSSNVYNQHTRGSHFTLQDWKSNPMWKPIKALTNMEALPDKRVSLQLPPDVLEKLQYSQNNSNSAPHYSIRLFCASNDYYRPPGTPYSSSTAHISNRAIPIEFPNNPDIVVDSYAIPFKEKGLRGQPGSAPPFDIGKSSRGLQLSPGRLTSVAFGHTGPTTSKRKDIAKKFFFQLVLSETSTKEELLTRLQNLTPTPASEALALSRKDDDDDIQFGSSVLKLRDPLSYLRMETPVRSKLCTHVQCFEARWWIEQNATHPRWRCPHCDKELNFNDMIVDGALLDILKAVDEDVEEVILEADGKWHTEDGRHGSAAWLTLHPPPPPISGVPTPADSASGTTPRPPDGSASPEKKPKRPIVELLSESEDETEGQLSSRPRIEPPLSISTSSSRPPLQPNSRPTLPGPTPSATSSRISSAAPISTDVIDLTLDSDDEDAMSPSRPAHTGNGASQGVVRQRSESTESPFHRPGAGNDRLSADGSSRPTRTPSELARKLPELGQPHPAWVSASRLGSSVPPYPTHVDSSRDPRLMWSNPAPPGPSYPPPHSSTTYAPPAHASTLPLPSYAAQSWGSSRSLQAYAMTSSPLEDEYRRRLPPVTSGKFSAHRPTSPPARHPSDHSSPPAPAHRGLPSSSWRPDPASPAFAPSAQAVDPRDHQPRSDDSNRSEEGRRAVSTELPRFERWLDYNDHQPGDHQSHPNGNSTVAAVPANAEPSSEASRRSRPQASDWMDDETDDEDRYVDWPATMQEAMEATTREWDQVRAQRTGGARSPDPKQ